jgi:hypothetical protein
MMCDESRGEKLMGKVLTEDTVAGPIAVGLGSHSRL